jgi:hypothetical protein
MALFYAAVPEVAASVLQLPGFPLSSDLSVPCGARITHSIAANTQSFHTVFDSL